MPDKDTSIAIIQAMNQALNAIQGHKPSSDYMPITNLYVSCKFQYVFTILHRI